MSNPRVTASAERTSGQGPVPFLDLKTLHAEIAEEILGVWREILVNAAFVGGPHVTGFEEEFARFVGADACAGVSSGTDALRLALLAMGLKSGDEVITTPNTFIATTEAISQAGGKPVFVDVDRLTGTIDPGRIEDAITPHTRVLLPVHLYGQPAEMDTLLEIANRRGLQVLEDAAQAQGAEYRGRRVGSFGDAAAFSFYPGKNLGACGEAGAVTTNDPVIAERVRMLRDHGQPEKYLHVLEGYNARLDALQAAALRIKLRHLDRWNAARRRAAERYACGLADCDLELPVEAPERKHVWHLYVVRHADRDRIMARLKERGVFTGMHYPVPLHMQEAYRALGHSEGDFPECERWASRLMSLPIFPDMTDDQVDRVCEAVRDAVRE